MTKYEELADLIFPDIKETKEDLEKRFPKRNLPEGAMVTRFAPSPTGFLHSGSLFAAMIARKFAVQSGGVFYIRLEDTDQKREVAGSGAELIKQLAAFGVTPSEGYLGDNSEIGSYGPYVQSKRADIYKVIIKYMLQNNMAYPCFCSTEELAQMHTVQEQNKENYGYYGKYAKCSNLTPEEAIEKIKSGANYVIRFRSKGDYRNRVTIHDAIRGDIEMAQNDQHIVIYKSDGLPTYHFAHLVDDHFMHTTHVTRGEEWLPSLPVHIELFESMGYEKPTYAHLPVVMKIDSENGNKRKLSKRKDNEAAVSYFLEKGYPISGFMEYLYTIANSNFEEWRDNNPTSNRDEFMFSFEKMSSEGPLFDLIKIQSLCKDILGNMTTKEFAKESTLWAKEYDQEFYQLINRDPKYYEAIVSIEREKDKPRKDYEKFMDVKPLILFYYDDLYEKMVKENGFAFQDNIDKNDVLAILQEYVKIFKLELAEEDWFAQLKEVAVACGFAATPKEYKKNKEAFKGHVGDVASVLRVVTSLRLQSPNLYNIMLVIGKERLTERFMNAIELLRG